MGHGLDRRIVSLKQELYCDTAYIAQSFAIYGKSKVAERIFVGFFEERISINTFFASACVSLELSQHGRDIDLKS